MTLFQRIGTGLSYQIPNAWGNAYLNYKYSFNMIDFLIIFTALPPHLFYDIWH
jgi:hypothetical protein